MGMDIGNACGPVRLERNFMLEISEIPCSLKQGATEASCLDVCKREAARLLRCDPKTFRSVTLHRKSIDARKKAQVHFTLSARFEVDPALDELELIESVSTRDARRVRVVDFSEPTFEHGFTRSSHNEPHPQPIVVGAGCAGLFAALTLAEAGLFPLLIEMGDDAERRTDAVARFNATGELDPASNIQFGLGGAGTFSDGKLNTGTKNPLHRLVLRTLVEAGAPRNILWDAKPHIGSDVLPTVVTRMIDRIRSCGGTVRFRTKLVDIKMDEQGKIAGITVEHGGQREHLPASHIILACGHSARDVFELLLSRNVSLARKTFAMGVRIEHLQVDIDKALYGTAAGHPSLGAAPYSLVAHLKNGRSLFSFCMCPGGEVVAAASEPGGVVTNGASLSARNGRNANAALLVNIEPDDLPGDNPLAGMHLQRSCEQRAFELGGGAYRAPAQTVGDFLSRQPSTGHRRIEPTYPRGVTWGSLEGILPAHVTETLREGIPVLGRKLKGYDDPDAVLTAPETRSSSPVTVVRDRANCVSVSTPGLYPCGEGAGYAGGIMSAATDGIRCAQALLSTL